MSSPCAVRQDSLVSTSTGLPYGVSNLYFSFFGASRNSWASEILLVLSIAVRAQSADPIVCVALRFVSAFASHPFRRTA